jgi:protein-tyrosine phosphatase
MSPLESIANFRDVGLAVNSQLGEKYVYSHMDDSDKHLTSTRRLRVGKLFRSARPDDASTTDKQALKDTYHVKTIVDLRTNTEREERGSKQHDGPTATIPDVDYVLISFTGSAYSRHLISQLSWWNFFRLIWLMAIGKRLAGISVLGINVMQPRGLIGLATDSLDVGKEEVKKVFTILADEHRYPVLLHCTQGKDRTGIVVQLVLSLLGVPPEVIDVDYMLSQSELVDEREGRIKEIRSIGLGEEFADCAPGLVDTVAAHIVERYGSLELYLDQAGVTEDMRNRVKAILQNTAD